jgi:manganese transport protein
MLARALAIAPERPWRRYLAFAGPGALVAVGYVDPGNWATDLAGGSRYAYTLLFVVAACSLVAILFQVMSARLGIATGRDLATLTREAYPRAAPLMWAAAELAVIATELAEVLGSAIALQLLFGISLLEGVVLTAFDVVLLMALERYGARALEAAVFGFVAIVGAGLAYELALAQPQLGDVARGLVPTARVAKDPEMLLCAVGILGATVMPHNLYLHSSLVQATRKRAATRTEAARHATLDTLVSLGGAMLLNGALVILAGAVFFGREKIAGIEDAHRLLAPLLSSTAAPAVFALALLAAGQSATITGTLAGQVIMSGLLDIRWPAWQRRLATRACAIVPAIAVLALSGEASTGRLLVVSQVVLSLQLPFALVPLVILSSDRARMGRLANGRATRALGWACIAVVVLANGALIVATLGA